MTSANCPKVHFLGDDPGVRISLSSALPDAEVTTGPLGSDIKDGPATPSPMAVPAAANASSASGSGRSAVGTATRTLNAADTRQEQNPSIQIAPDVLVARLASPAMLAELPLPAEHAGRPLLLLVDAGSARGGEQAVPGLRVLESPASLLDLRAAVDQLASGPARVPSQAQAVATAETSSPGGSGTAQATVAGRIGAAGIGTAAGEHGGGQRDHAGSDLATLQRTVLPLEPPFFPESTLGLARAAARLREHVWLHAEAGSGRRRVARLMADTAGASLVFATDSSGPLDILNDSTLNAAATVVLGDVDRLSGDLQDELADKLELPDAPAVIAVSGRDLGTLALHGEFSRRLYHCLSSLVVRLPALRERPEALDALVPALLNPLAERMGIAGADVDDRAMELLQAYPWPGNLAELRSVLLRSLAWAAGTDGEPRGARPLVLGADDLLFSSSAPKRQVVRGSGPGRGIDAGGGEGHRAASIRGASTDKPVAGGNVVSLELAGRGRTARGGHAASGVELPPNMPEAGNADIADTADTVPDGNESTPGARLPAAVVSERERAAAVARALAEIVDSLSHEIRNPLTPMKGSAELLREFDELGIDPRECAEQILNGCVSIQNATDVFQEFTDLEDGGAVTADLAALFAEALDGDDGEDPLIDLQLGGGVEVKGYPSHLRFIIRRLVEFAAVELAEGSRGVLTVVGAEAGRIGLQLSLPTSAAGTSVLAKLRRVGGRPEKILPWRLGLAKNVAVRGGGGLEVRVGKGPLSLRWDVAEEAEEMADGS